MTSVRHPLCWNVCKYGLSSFQPPTLTRYIHFPCLFIISEVIIFKIVVACMTQDLLCQCQSAVLHLDSRILAWLQSRFHNLVLVLIREQGFRNFLPLFPLPVYLQSIFLLLQLTFTTIAPLYFAQFPPKLALSNKHRLQVYLI
jgi:hypothetical protein